MQNLLETLKQLLSKDERFMSEGKLLKNQIMEYAIKLDESLIKLLMSDTSIKKHFFKEIAGALIFDKEKFMRFVSNKQFLPDSYTAFKNKIGLSDDGMNYLSQRGDVTLVWPYKDCVLEGGQTKEEAKRDEIFWNETLAPDEINRLLEPKVLSNFTRYDKSGDKKADKVSDADNLIIKGNNLLSLKSLEKIYRGKIKLIYIDPPYNPESSSNTFCYNNNFNESTWLTFMKNRLEVARSLLSKDGVLVVAIDKNEHIELGILIKEIFMDYELHCITIVHNPRGVQGTNFSYTHEYALFVFPRGKKAIGDRKISDSEIDWAPLRNWGGESERSDAKNCFYPIIVRDGEIVGFGAVLEEKKHPKSQTEKIDNQFFVWPIDKNGVERKWRYARQSVEEVQSLLRVKKTKTGYDIEIGKDFGSYKTVWIDPRYDANEYGTELVKALVPGCKFDFPKSLYNVYDCLYAVVANDKQAIVLDFFAGSGTTAHAVLDLNKEDGGNRKFILCEQMHYVDSVTKKRVHAVIKNNKEGSFVFCDLMQLNEKFTDQIQEAKTKADLEKIWNAMQKTAFLSYRIDLKSIDETALEFGELSPEDQKRFLMEVLDKNMLYVNYSDIDDADYKVSAEDKKLNHQFYSS